MPIDFTKYGADENPKTSKKGIISVDFSNYEEAPAEPKPTGITPTQMQQQFGVSNLIDVSQSPRMKEIHRSLDTAQADPGAADSAFRAEVQNTPKKLPALAQIQKDIYDNTIGAVQEKVTRFGKSLLNTATFGIYDKTAENAPDFAMQPIQEAFKPAQTTADKVADIAGDVAGTLLPGAGSYASGGRLAAAGFRKLSPKIINAIDDVGRINGIGNASKFAQMGARGVGAGATYATADQAIDAGLDTHNDGSQTLGERAKRVATDAALFGAGDAVFGVAGQGLSKLAQKYAGSKIGQALERFRARPAAEIAPEVQQTTERAFNTYKNPAGPQTLDEATHGIMQEVSQRITPPLESPKLLDKYLRLHLGEDIPKSELDALNYNDKTELAQHIRDNVSVHDVASQVAKERGYNWNDMIGQPKAEAVPDTAFQATHTIHPDSVGGGTPVRVTAEGNMARYTSEDGSINGSGPINNPRLVPIDSKASQTAVIGAQPIETPKTNPVAVIKPAGTPVQTRKPTDELRFAQTVKESPHTAPELLTAMNEKPMAGARTSDILNREEAAKLIDKHGREGLYGKLMAKTKQFSSSETTAAQMLAKHYSSLGGEENLSKAIDLVSKTAKGGREMGQAIQALSQWNKLDAEGALLLGERQLNRGIKDTSEWKKLSAAQGAPITEAAQRIGSAQETKNLADEVLNIVTNKQAGEALTDAEKATVKQFQDQVKLINEKGKGILSQPKANKAAETIKEVSQIEPKARTRDQVVNFLDAKAEKARQRLARSRNIGALPSINNPVFDYAIIGSAHIAKGVVKLSDFTEAMVKDFGEAIKPHINEVFTKATNIFRKENGLPTVEELDRVVRNAVKNDHFTPEDAGRFKAWAAEIGHMSDEFKREATQDLQAAMKDLGDSTLGQKIATIQTAAQLLNPVTIARNVIGNAALVVTEKINKMAAVPIDLAFSTLTGERTIQWLPQTQEKMLRNFMMGTEAGWKGVSPSGTLDSYGIHPNVFSKNNPLKYTTKSLGASMQGFDFAAYRVAYGDVLATYGEQLGKAQGLSKADIRKQMPKLIEQLDQRIHDLADEAGRYATFQDDTLLSQGAEMLKRGLNKVTDLPVQKLVERGLLPKALSTEGFGVGDIVLKYAKTPANLIMRAIDYSPIGFLRATMEIAPLFINKAKFNQFQATRALSRAITGTLGLTGMGYILADAGILTGSSSMDKDTRSIQEQSGQGAYKVNWSALSRFIMGGLDYEAAKYQKGDTLMDYAWLQPAAISVAMGVNANKAVNDKKNGSDVTGWQVAQKAILGGLQTVLENPMVQGVSQVVDAASDIIKKQDATKLKNIGKGVPATFVPTLSNQLRTATDNNQRETFDKNLLTEMGNLMKNKVPGLSKTLPVSYDSLGHAREKIQGGQSNTVSQYLTAFFSPAKMTEYQVSPEAKIVLDLMNQSGDQNVLPRISDRYIHIDQGKNKKDLKVDLTAEQYSRLQQNVGKMVEGELAKRADYLSNPGISLKNKVDRVKTILTDVGKKAREEIGTQMGYKKKDIKK